MFAVGKFLNAKSKMPLLKTSSARILILIEFENLEAFWVAFGHFLDTDFTYTQALELPQCQPRKLGFGVVEVSLVCTYKVCLVK